MDSLDIKKQYPFDEFSILKMDIIIDSINDLINKNNGQFSNLNIPEYNRALFCEIFISLSLGLESFLKGRQIELAPIVKSAFGVHIELAQSWFTPLLSHNLSRGISKNDVFIYSYELFIRRLYFKFPVYIPPVVAELFR